MSALEPIGEESGRTLYCRRPGLEFTPVILGRVASFVVALDGRVEGVFAFMLPLLEDRIDDPPEEQAMTDAVEVVRRRVRAGDLSRSDSTFEWRAGEWAEVDDPRWWISVRR